MTSLQKFQNNKGITIIHALVSVLIFGVFSSIILNSTSSNLKSIEHQVKYQQAYVTVTNAANLFLDSIDGDIIQFNEIYDNTNDSIVITEDWEYREAGATYDENNTPNYDDVTLYNPLANYNDLDEGDIPDYVILFRNHYDYLNEIVIKPDTTSTGDTTVTASYIIRATKSGEKVTPVKVELILDHYNMFLNFSLDTTDNDNYYLWIQIPVDDQYVNKDGTLKIVDSERVTKARNINDITYKDFNVNTYVITYDVSDAQMHKGVYKNEQ